MDIGNFIFAVFLQKEGFDRQRDVLRCAVDDQRLHVYLLAKTIGKLVFFQFDG